MAVGIEEYLQQLLGMMGSGTNDLRNLETVFRSLNQQTSTLGTLQREGVGAINSFKQGIAGLKSAGNLSQVMTAVSGLNMGFDRIVTSVLVAGKKFVVGLIGGLADSVTYMTGMVRQSMTGFEGAMKAQIGLIATAVSKGIGGTLGPKLGGAIGGVLETALEAFKIMFGERLARSKAAFALWAAGVEGTSAKSAGKPAGEAKQAADWLVSEIEKFGTKESAGKMIAAAAGRGVSEKTTILELAKVSAVMQMSEEETTKHLETQIIMYGKGEKALKSMTRTFDQMRDVAVKTGLPARDLVKYVMDAAAGARFLNADMGLVNNTMTLIGKHQAGLAAMGIDPRQKGKGMLEDLSGATGKITDEMHAFFGSEGGKTDAMQGWLKSKYGADTAEKVKVGPGGQISGMEGASPSKMMEQRLMMIKNMMSDAAKSAGGDAAKSIFVQREMAAKLGLGDEAAQLLMQSSMDEIGDLANNPKLVSSLKTQEDNIKDIREMASIDQAIQRMMASLSVQQLTAALAAARIAQLELNALLHVGNATEDAAEAAALEKDIKAGMQATFSQETGMMQLLKSTVLTGAAGAKNEAVLNRLMYGNTKAGPVGTAAAKAFGGSISAYTPRFATGGAIVGEQGPEYFKPSIPGEISSNRDLMNATSAGRGNKDVTINITMPALSGPDLIAQINSSLRGL